MLKAPVLLGEKFERICMYVQNKKCTYMPGALGSVPSLTSEAGFLTSLRIYWDEMSNQHATVHNYRSRIHERFLGIILIVLRLEVSIWIS